MRAIQVVVVLVVALLARPAAAADALTLSWSAPAGCPSGDQVRSAALRATREKAASERDLTAAAPLEAEARVERAGPDNQASSWRVTIRARRGGVAWADRTLEAASCDALADATSVILALALMPPGSAADAAPPTAVAVAPDAPDAPETTSSRRAPVMAAERTTGPGPGAYDHALAAGAELASDGTTLPSAALGGRVVTAWTPARARVELSAAYFSAQSETAGQSAAGARFTLVTIGARGCWAVARGDVEVSPCVGADTQLIQARGFGAAANYDASAAWMSVAGGLLVRVPLTSWLALRGGADAIVPLARPRFVVEGDGAVHRPAALGVRGTIGAEIVFL